MEQKIYHIESHIYVKIDNFKTPGNTIHFDVYIARDENGYYGRAEVFGEKPIFIPWVPLNDEARGQQTEMIDYVKDYLSKS
ncbi:hypothetical protein KK159_12180 [Bacillus velezensis]|uniref:hypothetical protein n=1 Tax=Bacillus TaxID=1386 RepID=UPI0005AD4533|nr:MULTISPECIES: hypothetical protein [Bacillus amyloliquefaciens group]AJK64929.1 hypothetical protein KHU1_0962 [Bacillus amyloliquefaciens KHG19]MCZ4246323.1 hypothetical protein [Bacillus amyloliquefaciens]MCZ4247015.1 hypothetical protein [Bacillus amyloliquefaciens]MEC1826704.1 hypothetical protein [Bacillus velezensis]NMW08048.1 hypothetical protein [Bacillus velezensis]